MLTAGRSRCADGTGDDGYTLVELIISIAVLGILMVALASISFTTLKVNGETKNRVDGSRNPQVLSVYLANDAQSARPVGGMVVGGTASCSPAETAVLELRGDTYAPGDVAGASGSPPARFFAVSYVLRSATRHGRPVHELWRIRCEGTAANALTPVAGGTVAVARSLQGTTSPAAASAVVTTSTTTCPGAASATTTTDVATLTVRNLDGTTAVVSGKRRTEPCA